MKKQEWFDLGGILGLVGGLIFLLLGIMSIAGAGSGLTLGFDNSMNISANLSSIIQALVLMLIGIVCMMLSMRMRERKRTDKGMMSIVLLILGILFLSIPGVLVLLGGLFGLIGAIK